jgi:hypothetical protein
MHTTGIPLVFSKGVVGEWYTISYRFFMHTNVFEFKSIVSAGFETLCFLHCDPVTNNAFALSLLVF